MKAQSNRPGFSLAEILVAIAIAAVVAAVVVPSIGSQLRSGDESRMQQDLKSVQAAAEQFLADVRRYPKNIGQLTKQPTNAANTDTALTGTPTLFTSAQMGRWRGPYLSKDSASMAKTGLEIVMQANFTSATWSSQAYLTVSLLAVDTATARSLDRRMDDGVNTTGALQWSVAAATTTISFFALPIQ